MLHTKFRENRPAGSRIATRASRLINSFIYSQYKKKRKILKDIFWG